MPYGAKRGVKAPGDYGFMDMTGLALAGAAGILAALVTDYQQSGETSALYTINQWVVSGSKLVGFGDVPLWMVVAGLVVIGAGSIFYFQPITRQGAFAQGFGLLAVLMTATPANLGAGLSSMDGDLLPGLEPISFTREAAYGGGVVPAAYTPGEARVHLAQDRRGAARYDVRIAITFPNGLPADLQTLQRRGDLRGRLHNPETGSTFDLFRTSGGTLRRSGDTLYIDAGVPARSETGTLWVRIEIAGYAIEQQSAQASLNSSLEWNITMRPSSTPLFMQRLNQSYWF